MKRRTLLALTVAGSVAMGAVGGALLFSPVSSLAANEGAASQGARADMGACGQHGPMGGGLEVAADTIGIEPSDLFERLHGGQTVAEVAADEGVNVDTVIEAMVADGKERLDDAVADGMLTEQQAKQITRDMQERVTAMVNGEMPEPGSFGPMHGDGGMMSDGHGFAFGPGMHS